MFTIFHRARFDEAGWMDRVLRGSISFLRFLRDRKSARLRGEGGEIGRKRTRDFGAILLFLSRSVDRCSSPPLAPIVFPLLSRRPTFSIAQSVVYLGFISISHGAPRRPLSLIPSLCARACVYTYTRGIEKALKIG